MPRTPSHISTLLCSLSCFKFLVLHSANLSKTVSYVSHHLVSFFLRFLPFSPRSQSPTSCTCLHMETSSIRLEGLVSALFRGVYLQYWQKSASPCGTVTGWCIYQITSPLSSWTLTIRKLLDISEPYQEGSSFTALRMRYIHMTILPPKPQKPVLLS